MREAAYWIPRSGHTQADETEALEAAAARAMADVGIDECIREIFDSNEDFVQYLAKQNRKPVTLNDQP